MRYETRPTTALFSSIPGNSCTNYSGIVITVVQYFCPQYKTDGLDNRKYFNHFGIFLDQYSSWKTVECRELKKYFEQECIPVGCVPPAAVAVRGGLHRAHPPTRHPPVPGTLPPVDRHTPVNILHCSKLRLRAVKILKRLSRYHADGKNFHVIDIVHVNTNAIHIGWN